MFYGLPGKTEMDESLGDDVTRRRQVAVAMGKRNTQYDPLSRLMQQSSKSSTPGDSVPSKPAGAEGKTSPAEKGPVEKSGTGTSGKSSSESEFSDFPSSEHRVNTQRRVPSSKVRIAAFHCAQIVIKSAPKQVMNGYWQSFVPDHPNSNADSATILTYATFLPRYLNFSLDTFFYI